MKKTELYIIFGCIIIILIVVLLFLYLRNKDKFTENNIGNVYDPKLTINLPADVLKEPNLKAMRSNASDICVTIPIEGIPIPVCLSTLINIGKKAWDLYVNNIAKVDIHNDYGTAVPCVVQSLTSQKCVKALDWKDMYGWQVKNTGPFNVIIDSGWPHFEELNFTFNIECIYGGKVKNDNTNSLYIQRVAVVPIYYSAIWGSSTSIRISNSDPFNISSNGNTVIACLEVSLDITVEDPVFSTKRWNCNFFVGGDGKISQGACSNWHQVGFI